MKALRARSARAIAKSGPGSHTEKKGTRRVPSGLSSQSPLGAISANLLQCWNTRSGRGLLFLGETERRVEHLGSVLHAFDPTCGVMVLPAWDCSPYDGTLPSREVMGRRSSVLRRLSQSEGRPLVLATAEAALQRVPPRNVWKDTTLAIRPGMRISEDDFSSFFAKTGYALVPKAQLPGEAAFREQVVDVFPAGALLPLRIEYFDQCIRSISCYDPETQRTSEEIGEAILDAASELHPAPLANGAEPATLGSLAAHYGKLATLFEYLPGARIVADAAIPRRVVTWVQQIEEGYQARQSVMPAAEEGGTPDPPSRLFLTSATWDAALADHETAYLTAASADPDLIVPQFSLTASPVTAFRSYLKKQLSTKRRLVLTGADEKDIKALQRRAGGAALGAERAASLKEALASHGGSTVTMSVDLEAGFVLREHGATVIAASDLLGTRAAHATLIGIRHPTGALVDTTAKAGDVIVHRDRGIGILRGLESISTAGLPAQDMIRLEFADDKTVLVPVEELACIWKYSSDPSGVSLDRADGTTWSERRAKLESEIADAAQRLVELARKRESLKAETLVPPAAEYERFAAGFRHFATADQANAVQAVLGDLASGHPMDRLVCGDVGFGKTEVALRAAAAVALCNKQVAVAVPTTVLALQHLNTFQSRFGVLGLEVGHLSRFVSSAEARKVKKAIADGSLRIVIGTHALASEDVSFRDLGLIIIDEEQRFGTRDKEKLRKLGDAVHILTMSATPIPRTLGLATVGLQKLSLIATPPVRRLPIQTTVAQWDTANVARALQYERLRGGQSFVVCPRIEDIAPMREQLAEIAPELNVLALHGRMPTRTIDATMVAFSQGKGDVLLTTSIIENGLDIPRANTMLVWRPDRFGLAQLHQLRGRVGRASRRGLVYFLLDSGAKKVAEAAQRRLELLAENSELGSGLGLSKHDMDLRGAGTLLGAEQSGHVKLVGPELYRDLLVRAVRRARGENVSDLSPELRIGSCGSIPPEYAGADSVRLEIYIRLAKAALEATVDEIEDEVEDRFGPAPPLVRDLIEATKIRLKCKSLGIARIEAGPHGVALSFHAGSCMRTNLPRGGKWQEGRLIYKVKLGGPQQRLVTISALLRRLALR